MPIEIPEALSATRQLAEALAMRRDRLIARPLDPAGRRQLADLDRELAEVVARQRLDPCDASPDAPLVLLPVRIETVHEPAGTGGNAGPRLLVRITPDEVHVDTLRRALTPEEVSAGQAWWQARWQAVAADGSDPDAQAGQTDASQTDASQARAADWSALVEAVGPRRAGWVAQATLPINRGAPPTEAPVFPEPPTEVSGDTVARCLPDRFVVRVFPRGAPPITEIGRPIPRDLALSPLALGDDALVAAGKLKVPAGSEWTVDFTEALRLGLAVVVPLPANVSVIDCVVVTGTRQSVSEAQNAADLANLLLSHRYSDGIDLLAHGTPTNNADAARSPYRPDAAPAAPPLDLVAPSVDAVAAATLLGLSAADIEDLLDPAAPRSGLGVAQTAANTALWYATWAPVLDRIDADEVDGVTPAAIESARRLHRESVRAAGHCPALRVGAQAYGLLPVTDLDGWQPRAGEFTAVLAPLVRRLLRRWVARAGQLPHVSPGDEVSDEAMLEMLGTAPVSTAIRVRPAVDGPKLTGLAGIVGADAGQLGAERQLMRAVLSQYSVELATRLQPPSLHDESRRIALPLVSARDAEVIADILADRSPKVDSVLQALLDIAWDEARRRSASISPATHLPTLVGLLGVDAVTATLVNTAATTGPLATVIAGASTPSAPLSPAGFRAAAAGLRSQVRFDGQPLEAPSLAAFEPVAEARTSLAQVALDLGDTPEARWIGQHAVAGILELFANRWEMRDAMLALGAASIDERRIAVGSAIDLASHRLDAWATGIAADRQRTLANGEGMTLGAFGYVENIHLKPPKADEGWLQAPSSAHAVTAGLLASAHRSRIGAKAGRQPFAIDLSSRRGPELRRVLEGIRAGQSIGALLGYQIERALTGSAARFQLSLRELAPLDPDTLGTDLPVGERTARSAMAAVVDGARLLSQFPVESLQGNSPALRQRLDQRPANPYLGTWTAVTPAEWEQIKRALGAAAETLDAVSDALLAESVFHYASGNAARASAAMDAAASGGAVDPELGVLGVRQTTRTLGQAAFAVVASRAGGWSTTRPRALAEPRLEAWAASRLGDPADIIVVDGPAGRLTLADVGVAALDLVFADDFAALDRDLRAALPALAAAPFAGLSLADKAQPGWPAGARPIRSVATLAGSLRALAAGAMPLLPPDLVPAGADDEHRLDLDDLQARCEALLTALGQALAAGAEAVGWIDPDSHAVAENRVAALTAALAPLAAFGVALVPDPQIPANASWALGAWQAASARWEAGSARLAAARAPHPEPLTAKEWLDVAQAIAETVLGDGFRLLPLLRQLPPPAGSTGSTGSSTPANSFATALTRPSFAAPAVSRVAAFIRDHATVRAGIAKLAEARLIGRALGLAADLTVVQLTDGGPGSDRWLAGPLADDQPWPAGSASHCLVDLVGIKSGVNSGINSGVNSGVSGNSAAANLAAASDGIAGIVFDSWIEALPFRPDPRAFAPEADAGNPLRPARATTALAIHANQASARAPQVILSAVPADRKRWTTDSLVRTILASIDVSRARLVTLENLPGDAAILPAAYVASPWLQPGKGFDFRQIPLAVSWARQPYPFVSEIK